MRHHFISEEEQFSCNSRWFDILLKIHGSQWQPPEVFGTLLKSDSNTDIFLGNLLSFHEHLYFEQHLLSCAVWSLGVAAYKWGNKRTKTSSWPFLVYQKIWWIVFVVWLTDERRLGLFPAGTIVRDPDHRDSLTRR